MAVVVAAADADAIIAAAAQENCEAVQVAVVTESPRLVMRWRNKKIVDISREFLNSGGAVKHASVSVGCDALGTPSISRERGAAGAPRSTDGNHTDWLSWIDSLEGCSRRGLAQRFDGTIGSASVFAPYGGIYQTAPAQVMAALFPALSGDVETCSVMAYGFDPMHCERDPFGGSAAAVVESVSKLVAAGVSLDSIYLSLQEYFLSLRNDPTRWGLPFSALLGAYTAQRGLGLAAVGGKDSMSGSYQDIDVPPTLVSFSVGTAEKLVAHTVQEPNNKLQWLDVPLDASGQPDYPLLKQNWNEYLQWVRQGKIKSARAVSRGGVAGAVVLLCIGGNIGFLGAADSDMKRLDGTPGGIVFESTEVFPGAIQLGETAVVDFIDDGCGHIISLAELREKYESGLEDIFPLQAAGGPAPDVRWHSRTKPVNGSRSTKFANPRVLIPVFPGTTGEYDTARAVENAGGIAETVLIRNFTPDWLAESCCELQKAMAKSQILILPGGFAGGDCPSAGKMISSFFSRPEMQGALLDLYTHRGGLILGIGNGFQALLQLGLLQFNTMFKAEFCEESLEMNSIGRHQSLYANTRVSSVLSPWTMDMELNDVHTIPISCTYGRFTAPKNILAVMAERGQIVFQYCTPDGIPNGDIACNPCGSMWAIEGICSPNGRVLGKMGHSERYNPRTAVNITGNKYQPLFKSGIRYFK
jgi:phosphoribosylformylglycinamidine synthase